MGGRGAGKTRAGAEWVRAKALGLEPLGQVAASRIALVGETMAEVRRVMIEGVSGLLGIHGIGERPRFEPSKLQLVWPSGAIAQMFSAENPEALRGPQFDAAWCDEIAKWRRPQRAWDMLQFGLRLGRRPQMVVTTTPRPIPLLKKLIADAATVVTRAATASNRREPGADVHRRDDAALRRHRARPCHDRHDHSDACAPIQVVGAVRDYLGRAHHCAVDRAAGARARARHRHHHRSRARARR